jgi:hypothetical protein
MSAGLGAGDEDETGDEYFTDDFARASDRRRKMMENETSPSVVRRAEGFEDESF